MDLVPKTTNKTAGRTPYPDLVKSRLDYEKDEASKKVRAEICPPSPIRRLRHRTMILHGATIYYHLIPDDIISVFVANGTAHGSLGYVQPAMKAVNTMMRKMEDGNPDPISLNAKTTAVLPIRDPLTPSTKNSVLQVVQKQWK